MNAPRGAVVVGVAPSTNSDRALVWAAREAELRRSPFHLLHAIPQTNAAESATDPDEIIRRRQPAYRLIARARPAARDITSVPLSIQLAFDEDASAALIDASGRADLIAVGARRHAARAGDAFSSVSQRVSAQARCPVVIVRDIPAPHRRRVVAAVQDPTRAEHVLRHAMELADRDGAPLTLCGTARHERLGDEALARWTTRFPGVHVTRERTPSNPVHALVRQSRTAAIIVLDSGTGECRETVLSTARCPILLVPQPRSLESFGRDVRPSRKRVNASILDTWNRQVPGIGGAGQRFVSCCSC